MKKLLEKTLKTVTVGLVSLFVSCSDSNEKLVEVEKEVIKEVVKEVLIEPSSLTIKFDSKFGSKDFELKKDYIINDQTINFNLFRYWVSNIKLIKNDNTEFIVPNSYYMIEENTDIKIGTTEKVVTYPANERESVTIKEVPTATYKSVQFSIGIDKKYNDNLSLQAGELNQSNGMTNYSWMWMTTYIFSKIEGTVSKEVEVKDEKNQETKKEIKTKKFVADTGLNKNYRTVTIDLSAPIEIKKGESGNINLDVDLQKIILDIDLFTNNTISADSPKLMSDLADKYTSSITLKK